MKLLRVTMQVGREDKNGWRLSFGLPTFYLDGDQHGLTTEDEAEEFLKKVVASVAPGWWAAPVTTDVEKWG